MSNEEQQCLSFLNLVQCMIASQMNDIPYDAVELLSVIESFRGELIARSYEPNLNLTMLSSPKIKQHEVVAESSREQMPILNEYVILSCQIKNHICVFEINDLPGLNGSEQGCMASHWSHPSSLKWTPEQYLNYLTGLNGIEVQTSQSDRLKIIVHLDQFEIDEALSNMDCLYCDLDHPSSWARLMQTLSGLSIYVIERQVTAFIKFLFKVDQLCQLLIQTQNWIPQNVGLIRRASQSPIWAVQLYETAYPEPSGRVKVNRSWSVFAIHRLKQSFKVGIPADLFDQVYEDLSDDLKTDIEVIPVERSQNMVNLRFYEQPSETLYVFFRQLILKSYDNYQPVDDVFLSCSRFASCSEHQVCEHPNLFYAKRCTYRMRLESTRRE